MSDPLASPLFLPVTVRIMALLIAGLVLVVLVERRRHTSLRQSSLLRRVGSWGMIAPVFIVATLSGPAGALALLMFITVQGLRELVRVMRIDRPYSAILLGAGLATPPIAAVAPAGVAYLPLAVLLAVSAVPLVRDEVGEALSEAARTLFAYVYLPITMSVLVVIERTVPGGTGIVLVIATSVALSDVLAFATGSVFGRRPLAPRLSPSKTRAGLAGNVVGAILGIAVMAFAIPAGASPVLVVALGGAICLGCVWGDLLESLIKRSNHVKDAGTLLPGFGGLLDRIDSLLVALPLSFVTLRLMGA